VGCTRSSLQFLKEASADLSRPTHSLGNPVACKSAADGRNLSRKETCEEITGLGVKGKKRKSRPSSFHFFIVHVFLFLILCSLFDFFVFLFPGTRFV
jgi:hypothetical protein